MQDLNIEKKQQQESNNKNNKYENFIDTMNSSFSRILPDII